MKILLTILLLLCLDSFGQEIRSAAFEYHHSALPPGIQFWEVYSVSNSKLTHYSISDKTGRKKKKQLKKNPHFVQAVRFLDSLLSADSYLIEVNPDMQNQLIQDTAWQKRNRITLADLKMPADSLNRFYLEKKFFNRTIQLPPDPEDSDSLKAKIRELLYRLEPQVIDGTPFQLEFSINSEPKINYSGNLFANPPKSKYTEWLALYLMQKKYHLFDESPIDFYFGDEYFLSTLKTYFVWRTYGVAD